MNLLIIWNCFYKFVEIYVDLDDNIQSKVNNNRKGFIIHRIIFQIKPTLQLLMLFQQSDYYSKYCQPWLP